MSSEDRVPPLWWTQILDIFKGFKRERLRP